MKLPTLPGRLARTVSASASMFVLLLAASAEFTTVAESPVVATELGDARPVEPQQASSRTGLIELTFHALGHSANHVVVNVRTAGGEASLPLHLTAGTAAEDVALLVAARLTAFGLTVHGPAAGGRSIFVDDVRGASVYADGGMRAALASVDGPVAALRVTPLHAMDLKPALHVSLSTRSPHDGSLDLGTLRVELDGPNGAPGASAMLHESSAKQGWISERPGGSGWRPIRDKGGREVVGVAAEVDGPGWQVTMEF